MKRLPWSVVRTLETHRRGSALVVVLIVIMMLSLGAYSFSQLMTAEARATILFDRDSQARALADSAIEVAAAVVGKPEDVSVADLYHSPELFGGIEVVSGATPQATGRYSLVAPVENDASGMLRNGMIDESSKWNINALLNMGLTDEELAGVFLAIPGMDDTIVQSIIDWLDADDEPREFGAEIDYYGSLDPPYAPRNGKLETLDELLKVQGVTPALLYGEDANRNGILDPNEDDGDISMPADNQDGVLDLGWSAFLTVYGSETNLRKDGSPKINLNQPLLSTLYDTLEEEFGADVATFIVAFRAYGPVKPLSDGNVATTGDATTDEDFQKLAEQVVRGLLNSDGNTPSTTRNGMDLSGGSAVEITSLIELIDAQVQVPASGGGNNGGGGSSGGNNGGGSGGSGGGGSGGGSATGGKTLNSPWTSGGLGATWLELLDAFSLSDAEYSEGRININQARRETLMGIPGMTAEVADVIVARKMINSDGTPQTGAAEAMSSTAWLFTEGLVDQQTLVGMDRFMTARGSVYRVQAIGHFDGGGMVARVEAVIDATKVPPAIISRRDLSNLGPGYRSDQLSGSISK
ncbi:Putative type II secretion system protein K [Caulifigura coniformis]|uniref:Type II secretion system protein K n=1 Tax=Caulifigura coniformis TaxID=2527983 RepID=A0A517SAR9_9PLAN|nr:type II secretion system protein GspK [Caulifigura coniformis]QDT53224.1 Putative type II secretion system protein K [Caulifigura coniformis]